jgi:hypothetical protein
LVDIFSVEDGPTLGAVPQACQAHWLRYASRSVAAIAVFAPGTADFDIAMYDTIQSSYME